MNKCVYHFWKEAQEIENTVFREAKRMVEVKK